MNHLERPELSISIKNYHHTPMVSISGTMEDWQGFAIGVAVNSFLERAERRLILDASALSFRGAEATMGFISALRSLPQEIHVHIVARTEIARAVRRANLGPCISASTTFDDLAEGSQEQDRYLTSRWMATADEREMPLAA
jgi:hypothetical protein